MLLKQLHKPSQIGVLSVRKIWLTACFCFFVFVYVAESDLKTDPSENNLCWRLTCQTTIYRNRPKHLSLHWAHMPFCWFLSRGDSYFLFGWVCFEVWLRYTHTHKKKTIVNQIWLTSNFATFRKGILKLMYSIPDYVNKLFSGKIISKYWSWLSKIRIIKCKWFKGGNPNY